MHDNYHFLEEISMSIYVFKIASLPSNFGCFRAEFWYWTQKICQFLAAAVPK